MAGDDDKGPRSGPIPFTWGELARRGFRVYAVCDCGHGATVDPAAVKASPDVDWYEVAGRLVCSKCGRKPRRISLAGPKV